MTTRRDFIKQSAMFGGFPILSSLGLTHTHSVLAGTYGVANFAQDSNNKQGAIEVEQQPLPYAAEALEPHIDARTMRIHYGKHYALYRIGLNKTLKQLHEARENNDFSNIGALSRALAIQAGGYLNHVIFWNNMAPVGRGGGGEPKDALADQIMVDFGGFDKFKAHFKSAALQLQGDGWVVLGYHPMLKRLLITQMLGEHELNIVGLVPLLMIDMWTHAYYLKYQYKRDEYLSAWWNVVNWFDVARRLKAATA